MRLTKDLLGTIYGGGEEAVDAAVNLLRDQFAAAALSGLLARPDIDDDPLEYHFLCKAAYKWADAMIEERLTDRPEVK